MEMALHFYRFRNGVNFDNIKEERHWVTIDSPSLPILLQHRILRKWMGWCKFMSEKWCYYMVYLRTLSPIETQGFGLNFGRLYRKPLVQS